jgi:aryl-alcohol dehydrogenase-like predicted oxidoreductase
MSTPRTTTLGDYRITRIGLGTNRLTDTPENRDFLARAVEARVDFIDAAHLYTGGVSERTIGAACAPFPRGDPGADHARVATQAVTEDRPDPGNPVARTLEDEPGRARSRAV